MKKKGTLFWAGWSFERGSLFPKEVDQKSHRTATVQQTPSRLAGPRGSLWRHRVLGFQLQAGYLSLWSRQCFFWYPFCKHGNMQLAKTLQQPELWRSGGVLPYSLRRVEVGGSNPSSSTQLDNQKPSEDTGLALFLVNQPVHKASMYCKQTLPEYPIVLSCGPL